MIAQIGSIALAILVGTEASAFAAAVFWSAAAFNHAGAGMEAGALVLSGMIGIVAAIAMWRMAARQERQASASRENEL